MRPASCSEEDWQKEKDRRRRQAEHDRQRATGTAQGKGSAARLTPANPVAAAESNAAHLTPVSPEVAAARADAAERVDQQRRERDAAGRGRGNDRSTPYWRARDRGDGKT